MKKLFTATGIAFRIWICTAFAFGLLVCFAGIMIETREPMQFLIFISLAAVVFSFPAFILLLIFIPLIRRLNLSWKGKTAVVLLLEFLITAAYGVLGAILRLLGLLFLNGEIRFSLPKKALSSLDACSVWQVYQPCYYCDPWLCISKATAFQISHPVRFSGHFFPKH